MYVAVHIEFTNYEKNINRYSFKLVGVDDTFLCLFGSNVGRNASDEGNEMLLQDILRIWILNTTTHVSVEHDAGGLNLVILVNLQLSFVLVLTDTVVLRNLSV